MQVTAEIRWFWSDDGSSTVHDWFVSPKVHGCPTAPVRERTDRYLVDSDQWELGIKERGGGSGIEIKGLVARVVADVEHEPFDGPVDIWTKWGAKGIGLDAGRVLDVTKRRWQRAFDSTGPSPIEATEHIRAWFLGTAEPPARGCNVEITRVSVEGEEIWWTFGFEAFGGLDTVATDLDTVAGVMAGRDAPALPAAACQSYPAWLQDVVRRR